MKTERNLKLSIGPARLAGALRYSFAGFRHAATCEAAFQQELVAMLVLTPTALLLPVAALEQLALLSSMLIVLAAELLNSAIEATVDRISLEHHPLSAQAKDMGSAAVLLTLVMSALCWAVIAGPVFVEWSRTLLRVAS